MSKYGDKVAREQAATFELETNEKGLVRIRYPESKLIDEHGNVTVTGPWCIDETYARRWWTNSEMGRQMREGIKMGLGAS